MQAARNLIKDAAPDVLLLQEVRSWDPVAELATVLPGAVPHVVSQFAGRPQNTAIVSNLPSDSAWFAQWKAPGSSSAPPRGYSFAALRLRDDLGFLLVYSVHFKSNLGDDRENVKTREETARQLLAHAKEMVPLYGKRGRIAVLIGGDFNMDIGGRFSGDSSLDVLKSAGLRWAWHGVPKAQRITIPAEGRYPADCFDHILYGGMTLKSIRVIDAAGVSDHNMVIASFSIP